MWSLLPGNFTHSSHSLQLWFSRVGATTTGLSTESLLSPTEKKRFSLTRSSYKRREFLFSRALMRHALSQSFTCPINEWIFIERPDLPPEISNLPNDIYISLSHSKNFICFAIANSPVGIDIELANKNRDFLALAKTFMSDEEIRYLAQNKEIQADIFYRTWCAKEAYYKAIPSTNQADLAFKDISALTLIKNETNWSLIEGKIEQFFVSVIVKNKPQSISYNYFPQKDKTYSFHPRLNSPPLEHDMFK
jgi:4'-phosphopantetheinyl transferase